VTVYGTTIRQKKFALVLQNGRIEGFLFGLFGLGTTTPPPTRYIGSLRGEENGMDNDDNDDDNREEDS
jgi:hypothetical protein